MVGDIDNKFIAYLELIRIYEWRIYFAALLRMFTGAAFAFTLFLNKIDILLACCAIITATAAILSINDFFDGDIDKINSPQRPIPSGRVMPFEALLVSGFFFITVILFTLLINFWCFIIASMTILLSLLYPILKRKGIVGHLTIGAISAMGVLFGGAVMSNISLAVILISVAIFLYFMVVNIVTSLKDIEGDRKSNARTLPVMLGPYKTVLYSAPFLLSGVLINILLFFTGDAHILIIPFLIIFSGWLILKFKYYFKSTPKNADFLLDENKYKEWVHNVALKLNFNVRTGAVIFFFILISSKILFFDLPPLLLHSL